MTGRRPWTRFDDARLIEQTRAANEALAKWSRAVQAGEVVLEGAEADAYRAGWEAARRGDGPAARRMTTRTFTARQRIAWAVGYGQGRASA